MLKSTFANIRVYLYSFSCCCLPKLRNPAKFSENSNLYSSRSSKVIDFGVDRKRICNFLFVINTNFRRISSFRDIDAFSFKIACFHIPPCLTPPSGGTPRNINVIWYWYWGSSSSSFVCHRHTGCPADEPVDAWRLCVPSGCVTGLEWSSCVGQNCNVFEFIPSATKDVPVSTVLLLTLDIP